MQQRRKKVTQQTHQDTHTHLSYTVHVLGLQCVCGRAHISTEWLLLLRVCRQKTHSARRDAVSASGRPLAKNRAAAFSDEDERRQKQHVETLKVPPTLRSHTVAQ